jgi:Yip1-like protein
MKRHGGIPGSAARWFALGCRQRLGQRRQPGKQLAAARFVDGFRRAPDRLGSVREDGARVASIVPTSREQDMEEVGGGPVGSPGLVDRVRAILLKPNEEWSKIDVEPSTIGDLYRGYVIPLAAIPPICGLIGMQIFGVSFLGITYHPSIGSGITTAVIQYAFALAMVYVLAVVIDVLAPNFSGTPNRTQAFKVAAYALTAGWVAGVFALVPDLARLAILGSLYGLYLLYLGLPTLMKVPQDKAVSYVVVLIIVWIVVAVVIFGVTAVITRTVIGTPGIGTLSSSGWVSGTMSLPGGGSLDLDKLQAAGTKMEQAAKNAEAAARGTPSAPVAAVDPATLQGLLPAGFAGLQRTHLSSASGGAAGMGGSQAEASYGNGADVIKLSVTDMGAAGALAALGSALNVQSTSQDEHGYQKMGKVNGRMTTEKWSNDSHSGTYTVLVGDRFMVSADGGGSIDALKAAVSQINVGALEQLSKS